MWCYAVWGKRSNISKEYPASISSHQDRGTRYFLLNGSTCMSKYMASNSRGLKAAYGNLLKYDSRES